MPKPYDKIVVIDFETRWDKESFTLSKLTTEEYIRDPRFKAFGICAKEFGAPGRAPWIRHADLPEYFGSIDWSRTAVLAHNAQFDVSIMEWVYDAHPCFIFDSLSMARALRGVEVGNSLMKLAKDFGLPDKGIAVHSTNGMEELDPKTERELAEYCAHDVFLCEQIFSKLMLQLDPVTGDCGGPYPTKELRLIDMTLKMYTRPVLELDQSMLTDALHDEKEKREALLQKIGVDESALASNKQFAEVLRELGMPPPYKKSKTTGKQTLALAKNDALFQAMLNGDNEDVAALCEARLKVKSTTERTRAQRFLDISKRGRLPVPLSYYGAKSGRWTACLVAETEVTVYDRHNGQCKKRIVDVLPDDLVWDGVEFVQHEGVQFSGYKEVMTYDGVTGTPDHKVFLDDETTLSLHDACTTSARIMDAAEPDDRALAAARARLKRLRW
jgi:DNA polymerase III epsilon subunit-like protein